MAYIPNQLVHCVYELININLIKHVHKQGEQEFTSADTRQA